MEIKNAEYIEAGQRLMFGETVAEMKQSAAHMRNLEDPVDLIGYALCILSDAQEVAARGQRERARQFTNKAKFFMSEAQIILRRGKVES